MAPWDPDKQVIINSVVFNGDQLDISFIEKRDQSPNAGLIKTLVLDRSRFLSLAVELEDILSDLVDAGLIAIRQPPETLDGSRRQRRDQSEEPDEG